jgi:hypothetical protein
LFPLAGRSKYVAFYYPQGDASTEFMATSHITVEHSHYVFGLTPQAWRHTSVLTGESCKIRLCSPVDIILLKAMLQRGRDEGKYDLEDIACLLEVVEVDKPYLAQRLNEVNSDERLLSALRTFDLI